MSGLFKIIRNRTYQSSGFLNDVKSKTSRLLRKLSIYLTEQSEKLTLSTKKTLVVIFCIVTGSTTAAIAFHALEMKSSTIYIEKISIPSVVLHNLKKSGDDIPILPERLIKNIYRFRKYMDSLNQTKAGQKKYDSIIKSHPGLIDSLNLTEQIYLKQTKFK